MVDQVESLRSLAAPTQAEKLRELADPKDTNIQDFAAEFNSASADFFGIPGDILNLGARGLQGAVNMTTGLESKPLEFMGGDKIKRTLREFDEAVVLPGEETDSLGGKVGEFVGLTASLGLPTTSLATATQKVSQELPVLGNITQRFVSDVGTAIKNNPVLTPAIENVMAALSGVGAHFAGEKFPDSNVAEFIGAMTAPLAPIVGIKAVQSIVTELVPKIPAVRFILNPIVSQGKKILEGVKGVVTVKGRDNRAIERFQRADTDPKKTLLELNNSETLPDLKPLTPAQESGNEGLLALEKSVIESSDALKQESNAQIKAVEESIVVSLQNTSQGNPEVTASTFREADGYLKLLMNTRLKIAAQRADERLADLGVKVTREEANDITAIELQSAKKDIRAQEDVLYEAVNPEIKVQTANARKELNKHLKEVSTSEIDDIPVIARTKLSSNKGKAQTTLVGLEKATKAIPEESKSLGKETTIKELRGLQKRLRGVAVNAGKGENSNPSKARIANLIADAIDDDLALLAGEDEALKIAVSFGREFRQVFNGGAVGKILSKDATGRDAIPSGQALERTVGTTDAAGRDSIDQLLKGTNLAAQTEGSTTDPKVLEGAIEDFIISTFTKASVRDGKVQPTLAQTFLRNNEQRLSRTPKLKQRIEAAIESGQVATLRQNQKDSIGKRIGDPKVSKAAIFIEDSPEKAFTEILKLNAGKQAKETQLMLNKTTRDSSGEATEGLQSALIDFITNSATKEGVPSGKALSRAMEDSSVLINKVLTTEQSNRLNIIKNVALKLDKAKAANVSKEGILGDKPSQLTTILARILGVAAGTRLNKHTGIGGNIQVPGIMSNRFKSLLDQHISDPGQRLIIDAVKDKSLFKEILMAQISGDIPKSKGFAKRLDLWVASVIEQESDK